MPTRLEVAEARADRMWRAVHVSYFALALSVFAVLFNVAIRVGF